jgi:hypothetical protein
MEKWYVRYRFNTCEIVEFNDVIAESDLSAIRKASETVFDSGYFHEDDLVDITVRKLS